MHLHTIRGVDSETQSAFRGGSRICNAVIRPMRSLPVVVSLRAPLRLQLRAVRLRTLLLWYMLANYFWQTCNA